METAIEIEILDKRGGVLFGTVQVESGNKKSQNSIPVAQDYDLIYKTVYTWLYLVILYQNECYDAIIPESVITVTQ